MKTRNLWSVIVTGRDEQSAYWIIAPTAEKASAAARKFAKTDIEIDTKHRRNPVIELVRHHGTVDAEVR